MKNTKKEYINVIKKYFIFIIIIAMIMSSCVTLGMKMKSKSYYTATSQVLAVSYNLNQNLAPNIVELTKTSLVHNKTAKKLKLDEDDIEFTNNMSAPKGDKIIINTSNKNDFVSVNVNSSNKKDSIRVANTISKVLCDEGKRLYKNSHLEIVGKAKKAVKVNSINLKRTFVTWFVFFTFLVSIVFFLYQIKRKRD